MRVCHFGNSRAHPFSPCFADLLGWFCLEAGAQVKLQAACSQLAGRLSEVAVGHVLIDSCQIGAIEQVGDFTTSVDLQFLREEEGRREGLCEVEIHTVEA